MTWVTGQLIGEEKALPMGWRETCAVDERMRFVMAAEKREVPFAAICRRFGVSRKVGYKWLGRYQEAGVEGLFDRSRAWLQSSAGDCGRDRRALRCGASGASDLGTFEGARLSRAAGAGNPGSKSGGWPAASTIGLLFDREGLTVKRKLRRRSPPSSAPFAHCGAANDVWCIDFKGWFLTGDGARCEPLTLTDAMSRYLLRCQALAKCDAEHVWPVLDAAFREFGLPLRLRSDNGPPFASTGVGGLSRLSVLVVKAGVAPRNPHRLLGRNVRHRNHRYEGAAVGFRTKLDTTLDLGEQSMVSANADIKAGMPGGAALTRNDVAGNHMLAAIGLDAKALARRITAVTR